MAKRKAKKTKRTVRSKKQDDTKLFAFLATFLSILGFVIALLAKKDDKYVMFYAKQSLVVFIAFVISGALMIIPILGWILSPILYVITFVLWIISWIYALSGEMKETPIIGQYADRIDL